MTTRKPAAKSPPADDASAPSFEDALARLEAIVAEMESGAVSLEKMIERFEEGQKLIHLCTRRLNEVERRIEILVKRGEEIAAEPFEASEDAPADAARPADDSAGKNELF